MDLTCGGCGAAGVPALAWRQFSNGTWHLAAACPHCERHLQWVPQTPEWLAAAPPMPAELAAQRKEEGRLAMNGIVVAFEGRLGQDAELRFLGNGNPMTSFSAAVETVQARGDKPSVSEWVKCVVFGDGAADLAPQLGKGDLVYIEGRLSVNRWTGNDGKEHQQLNVVASLVQPMGKVGKRALVQQAQQAPPQGRPMGAEPQRGQQRPAMGPGRSAAGSGWPVPDADDLPF